MPEAGIEPATSASSVRRVYQLSYPGKKVSLSAATRNRTWTGKTHLGLNQARLPFPPWRRGRDEMK